MQRRESTTYGSTMAFVGHASRHAVHVPQWSSAIGASYSSSTFSRSEPMKTHDPPSRVIKLVCLPIQPSPARSAQALSMNGVVSTQIFPSTWGQEECIQESSSRNFSF